MSCTWSGMHFRSSSSLSPACLLPISPRILFGKIWHRETALVSAESSLALVPQPAQSFLTIASEPPVLFGGSAFGQRPLFILSVSSARVLLRLLFQCCLWNKQVLISVPSPKAFPNHTMETMLKNLQISCG